MSYVAWETDPKAKPAGPKSRGGPTIDQGLIHAIFERTLAAYAEASLTCNNDSDRLVYKDGEGSIWVRYTNWLRSSRRLDNALDTANRATRACPEVSMVWNSLLLAMVSDSALSFVVVPLTTGRSYKTPAKRISIQFTTKHSLSVPSVQGRRRLSSMSL